MQRRDATGDERAAAIVAEAHLRPRVGRSAESACDLKPDTALSYACSSASSFQISLASACSCPSLCMFGSASSYTPSIGGAARAKRSSGGRCAERFVVFHRPEIADSRGKLRLSSRSIWPERDSECVWRRPTGAFWWPACWRSAAPSAARSESQRLHSSQSRRIGPSSSIVGTPMRKRTAAGGTAPPADDDGADGVAAAASGSGGDGAAAAAAERTWRDSLPPANALKVAVMDLLLVVCWTIVFVLGRRQQG